MTTTSWPIILIGAPGAGKTTVGAALAAGLGVGFTDTDAVVESAAGKPVADIFISDGEPEFRRLERGRSRPRSRGRTAWSVSAAARSWTTRPASG
jgi:shikimate kinase